MADAKTTLELPIALLRRVKARAAKQGRSMKSLVIEALEGNRALESLLGDQVHHELPVIVISLDPPVHRQLPTPPVMRCHCVP